MEHSDKYFANDANTVVVPAYTIFNVSAELRQPIVAANGWGFADSSRYTTSRTRSTAVQHS